MEPVLLAAIIVVGGIIALLCIALPVLLVVAGVYLVVNTQQNALNYRETLRNERAIAKMNLESYGGEGGEGGLDIMETIEAVTDVIGGLRNPQQQPIQETVTNGIRTEQNPENQ